MLSSRLEAVFDEFLHKVKEEFQMAKTVEVEPNKLKKNPINPNYGYKDEKSNRLDDHPSFMFRKRNLFPGWYSPKRNLSAEMKSKYSKKFTKMDKNHPNALDERFLENMNRRKDELRRQDDLREYREFRKPDHIPPMMNMEPNLKKCTCKHPKVEHVYDVPTKTKYSKNFRADGVSVARPEKLRVGYYPKKMNPLSAFTVTSQSMTHSSS